MEAIVQALTESLKSIPAEFVIALISVLPILELRGGMLAATLLGVEMWRAFFVVFNRSALRGEVWALRRYEQPGIL